MQLFPPFLLLATGIALLTINLRQPRFQFSWLVAASGSLAAYLALIVLRLFYPFQNGVNSWVLGNSIDLALRFQWDSLAWKFSLAMAVLLLGSLLTDILRASEPEWGEWTATLMIGGLVILGTLSANLFSLLVIMALIDLAILFIQLSYNQEPVKIRRALGGFGARTMGLGSIVLVALVSDGEAVAVWPFLLLILLLGFFLRMGVLPAGWAGLDTWSRERRLGTIVAFAPVATALIFLFRAMTVPLGADEYNLTLALLILPAFIVGLLWAVRRDSIAARSLWIFGVGTLALLSALRGLEEASTAWGLALLLAGALLYFYTWRQRWMRVIPLVAVWGASSLALSATWDGAALYAPPVPFLLYFFLILQAGLLAGYLSKARAEGQMLEATERWIQVLYPSGLVLIALTWFLLAWLPWKGIEWLGANPIWPGFVATAIGLGIWFGRRRWWSSERWETLGLSVTAQWNRFVELLGEAIDLIRRLLGFLTIVLEGRGGVLWAILLLTLLISLLASLAQ